MKKLIWSASFLSFIIICNVIAGGKLKITNSEGKVLDAELKNGDVLWLPAETHSAVNTGDTEIRLIVNELKR